MPLGGCPSRGGFRGLACFPATPRSRQIAQPSITPITTAGAHQAAKPISAHHHGLIPTPSGTSDCGHRPCPNHHTTGHASPLRPNPLRIPNVALAPGAVPHRPAARRRVTEHRHMSSRATRPLRGGPLRAVTATARARCAWPTGKAARTATRTAMTTVMRTGRAPDTWPGKPPAGSERHRPDPRVGV